MSQIQQTLERTLLKGVSRSFYLSFRVLPASIRPTIGLGYLLCRIADTLADAAEVPPDDRLHWLKAYQNLFESFPVKTEKFKTFSEKIAEATLPVKPEEARALQQLETAARAFNELERTDQSLIQSVIGSVIQGMEMDLKVFKSKPALPMEKDLEIYIHWIGGEPGRFWTNVCLAHLPRLKTRNRDQWVQSGVIFGTGLQMVNILRDLPDDLKNGRCYIPKELLDRHELTVENLQNGVKEDVFRTLYVDLIDQTTFRLERGLTYIAELPRFAFGLRAAVWLPLILGIKTLRELREAPTVLKPKTPIKLTRKEVYKVLVAAPFLLPFNFLLKRSFQKNGG